MSTLRPIVISLAGFDPTSGAGCTADIKTFEINRVYGMAVLTANTIQTEDHFINIRWENKAYILEQLTILLKHYNVAVVKIGIVATIKDLLLYVERITSLSPSTKIIWDPILKSSSGFDFTAIDSDTALITTLKKTHLITPNFLEIHQLLINQDDALQKAQQLSLFCDVLLKGGHNPNALGFDYFVENGTIHTLSPATLSDFPKHGSGCVLSSAIAANIAKGHSPLEASKLAKKFIENFFNSNHTLLGYYVK